MTFALDRLPPRGRVAVVRLRSLGDCVLTTPALELLHRARPDLRIAVVVEDRFRAVYEGNPALDAILSPDPAALRRWRPNLCWNLHGGTTSAWLTLLSGARWRAGFAHFRFPLLYNVRIPRAQQALGEERIVHTAEHVAAGVFHLGVPRQEIPRATLFADPSEPGAIIIHPIAATPEKTWPAERFLELAAHLPNPVFIGGPGDDLSAFSRYRCVVGAPLGQTKALLAGASLFIGNDSGPAHMAAAFGVPVVVLFGPSDVAVWRPWRTASEVLQANPITGISATQAIAAMDRLRVHA